MRKTFLCLPLLAIALTAVLAASTQVHKVAAAPYPIIYIQADGSIHPANANVTSSDNVKYTLTADINASIVVQKNDTVIDGARYTIHGNGSGTGITVSWRNNVTIRNVVVTNFYDGIYLEGCSSSTVTWTTTSANINVGIFLNSSSGNTLSSNTISNNFDGIYLSSSSNHNVLTGNTATGNWYGIFLGSSSRNMLSANDVSDNNEGIFLYSSSNHNVLTDNTAANNTGSGIHLDLSSNHNVLTSNTVSHNIVGIELTSSSNNTLIDNDSFSDTWAGIYLASSSSNTLINNHASFSNGSGIRLDSSSNNTLSGNTVSNNWDGFSLGDASGYNVLTGNIATNNRYSGILIFAPASSNTIFHNSFVNNTNQVAAHASATFDDGYPSGGNYWGNYPGGDSDHDGIGDTPYIIDANNTDHYPLMGLFQSFNTSGGSSVDVLSNSTIDSFQYFVSNTTIRMHVSNMTTNQTHGFCRIRVPYGIMSAPFTVTIDGSSPTYWNYTLYDDGTTRWIYFAYVHSTREVVIIPEFPSFLILSLFVLLALIVGVLSRKLYRKPTARTT